MPTSNLGLPLLAADQAQKHVTVNEGLLTVDGIVQCAIKELHRNSPPSTLADSDRYIVGNAPTGAWTVKADKLAVVSPELAAHIDGEVTTLVPVHEDGAEALITAVCDPAL